MAYLVVNRIQCNRSSGGAIQLEIGNQFLLQKFNPFSDGVYQDFDTSNSNQGDLGTIVAARIPIQLYDARFSDNLNIDEAFIEGGPAPFPSVTQSFNYDRNKWSDEEQDYISIRGEYDVTYQVIYLPGDVILTYAFRFLTLIVELIALPFRFLRDLFVSITRFFRQLFSNQKKSSAPK